MKRLRRAASIPGSDTRGAGADREAVSGGDRRTALLLGGIIGSTLTLLEVVILDGTRLLG